MRPQTFLPINNSVMNDIIVHIQIATIRPHPQQETIYGKPRPSADFKRSIAEHGVLQPCLITTATAEGFHIMIAGHNRLAAAIAAGQVTVPCQCKEYASEEDQVIDLVHSNKGREKTEAQKNGEVKALKSTLSALAKAREMAGVTTLSANADKGRTASQIAKQMNVSQDEVEARIAVHDDEYRTRFFEKMRAAGAKDKLVSECEEKWDAIRQNQEGGTKIRGAETAVKKLQKELLEKCPATKNAKVNRPIPGLRGRPQKSIFAQSNTKVNKLDHYGSFQTDGGELAVGAAFGEDGLLGVGFLIGDNYFVVPAQKLAEHFATL